MLEKNFELLETGQPAQGHEIYPSMPCRTSFLCRLVGFLLVIMPPLAAFATKPDDGKTGTASKQAFPPVKRLFFADSEQTVLAMNATTSDSLVMVRGLPVFDTPEFIALMKPYLGQVITDELIGKIGTDIGKYVRSKDRVTSNLTIPKQDVSDGTLRLVLKIGTYGKVVTKGNRWFSQKLLTKTVGVKPGEEICVSKLEQGIEWANANPFRRVQAIINNSTGDSTRADLILAVQERIPLRLTASYDNNNVSLLGEKRVTAALQCANLWGLDHQLTYQFSSSTPIRTYQAHSLDYRIPLPWHHYLQMVGAYAKVSPVFGGGNFHQRGQNVIADVKYITPISKGNWDIELSGGFDFKQANNNIEFGGSLFTDTKYDVAQAVLGATVVKRDKLGAWSASLGLNLSPGRMSPLNRDEVFTLIHANADASYVQATLSLQRSTELGSGWQHNVRSFFQATSSNLVGSEQMSIGGDGTVRGYSQFVLSGDSGYYVSNELLTPVKSFAIPKKGFAPLVLQARLLAFLDCGETAYYRRDPKLDPNADVKFDPLMSAGLGVRFSAANHLSFSLDYGWRIKQIHVAQPGSGRGHVRMTMAF
jgi:hemolysin activation/secretion protein